MFLKIKHRMGHVKNIPTMQFFTRILQNTQSKSFLLSLTECVWEFQNNALWDNMPYSIVNNYEHLPGTDLLEANTDVMAGVSSLEGDI